MPLPLGHTAIGLATYDTLQPSNGGPSRLGTFAFITLLANLPDLDVVLGLMLYGNGNFFHRGPTHSLVFALVAGYGASHLWRLWDGIPRIGFGICFGLVLSHVLADMVFTTAPVSLLWPLQVYWSTGFSGPGNVLHAVLFQNVQDAGLISSGACYVALLRLLRSSAKRGRIPAPAFRRWK